MAEYSHFLIFRELDNQPLPGTENRSVGGPIPPLGAAQDCDRVEDVIQISRISRFSSMPCLDLIFRGRTRAAFVRIVHIEQIMNIAIWIDTMPHPEQKHRVHTQLRESDRPSQKDRTALRRNWPSRVRIGSAKDCGPSGTA